MIICPYLCCIVLQCFSCRNNVDKREALENLDLILLCFDEIVDGGYAMLLKFSHSTSMLLLSAKLVSLLIMSTAK